MRRIMLTVLTAMLAGGGTTCLTGCVYRIGGVVLTSSNPRNADPAREKAAHIEIGKIEGHIHPLLIVQDATTETIETVAVIVTTAGAAFMP